MGCKRVARHMIKIKEHILVTDTHFEDIVVHAAPFWSHGQRCGTLSFMTLQLRHIEVNDGSFEHIEVNDGSFEHIEVNDGSF